MHGGLDGTSSHKMIPPLNSSADIESGMGSIGMKFPGHRDHSENPSIQMINSNMHMYSMKQQQQITPPIHPSSRKLRNQKSQNEIESLTRNPEPAKESMQTVPSARLGTVNTMSPLE